MNNYGVRETNGLNGAKHPDMDYNFKVDWATKGLYVTRLRLVSDRGFPMWNVSYCYGELNGEMVRIRLPFHELRKGRMATDIIEAAKRAGVYAKRLGILDNISTLNV
jgi:hypothetical protein